MAELVILDTPEDLPQLAADRVARSLRAAVLARGRASLALAGGTTPKAIYEALALRDELPWAALDFFFGDERCVPPDHEDSNFRMAHEALLQPRALAAAQIFRMEGERDDRDAAALAYDALLPERLDLLLLGMGPDGHTASLFPGDPALREPARRVLPVFGPKPPPWRLTLTPPAIRAAREVFVFAFGASKAPKVREALEGPDDPASTPIQLARDGVWFLDRAAASLLSAR
jgi:6-phosphogluconolactonase